MENEKMCKISKIQIESRKDFLREKSLLLSNKIESLYNYICSNQKLKENDLIALSTIKDYYNIAFDIIPYISPKKDKLSIYLLSNINKMYDENDESWDLTIVAKTKQIIHYHIINKIDDVVCKDKNLNSLFYTTIKI